MLHCGLGRGRAGNADPGFGRNAEKARRSDSASALGSPCATVLLALGPMDGLRRGESREGCQRRARQSDSSDRMRRRPGWSFGSDWFLDRQSSKLRRNARMYLGGEQSPWKDRVSPRWQRRDDTTDSSMEKGLGVGRSRRLEGSARITSVIRACGGWFGGFGCWTARGGTFGCRLRSLPPRAVRGMPPRPGSVGWCVGASVPSR